MTLALLSCGLAGASFEDKKVLLAVSGRQDEQFNSLMDIDTTLNLITVPIVLLDVIPLGVLQLSGRFGSLPSPRPVQQRDRREPLRHRGLPGQSARVLPRPAHRAA